MPRVKAIYVGNGEYVAPIARYGECEHPRDHLRFDSRFSMPVSCYCTACGQPWLHPFHGMTDDEITAHKERVEREYADLFGGEAA